MAETEIKKINGKTIADVTARAAAETLGKAIADKADKTGWDANKYIGTDAEGNLVEKDAPADGETVGSGIWYGVTTTAATENPKVVSTVTGDFKLTKGSRVGVKFIYGNIGAQSLNVDGTGDVMMVASNDENGTHSADTPVTYKPVGQVLWFTYDGQYFVVDDSQRATENTIGKVTISDSVSIESSTTAASSTAVKTAYDKAVDALNAVTALDTALAEAIGSGVVS